MTCASSARTRSGCCSRPGGGARLRVFFGVRRRRARAPGRRGADRADDRRRVDAAQGRARGADGRGAGADAVALARPQLPGKSRPAKQRGLDLVVALDFSRSMLATDVYPSRLERAKRELGELLATLGDDRVGLVAFAGETLTYPPTTDYAAVKLFWRDLHPWDMPVGGTAIGRAIRRVARSAGRAAQQAGRGGRDARAGDPAAHRRRGHRQRAAGGGGRGVEAGREDLHRRHRLALGRADPRVRRAGQGDRLRQGPGRQVRHLAARRDDAGRDRAPRRAARCSTPTRSASASRTSRARWPG